MFVSGLQITLVLATLYDTFLSVRQTVDLETVLSVRPTVDLETVLSVRPTVDPHTELLRAPKSATRSSNLVGDYHWRELPPVFVETSILLSRQKTSFVATNTYACSFVATKLCSSRQIFVVTKMILVAAPANHRRETTVFCQPAHCVLETMPITRKPHVLWPRHAIVFWTSHH